MSKSRLEWRVGLFVLLGLVLIAALMLQFSKGLTLFRSTYDIYLEATSVGGLKPKADVLMSGVRIGSVSGLKLGPEGTNVVITLRILSEYEIHQDARFVIDQSGFLGDQYVAIMPTTNALPPFPHQGRATAVPPFNLQEFTRSATGFISRVDETVKTLNDALANVTRILLTPTTLTNLAQTAANLRYVSDRALATVDKINAAVSTNTPALSQSASNLVIFSRQLTEFAAELKDIVNTNTDEIGRVVQNVETASASLKVLMADLESGKGLAGSLLQNDELAARASEIAHNLSITTSNLNRLGLWRLLWPRKPAEGPAPVAQPLHSPKAAE